MSDVNLLRFIAYLSHQQLLPRTIRVYLAGVRSWFVRSGSEIPDIFTPRVKLALRSLDREAPPPSRVAPISYAMISEFINYLSPSLDNIMLMSAFALAYFACLRAAEYCFNLDTSQGLTRSDIILYSTSPPSLLLTVRASKTLVHGFSLVLGCTHNLVCPVCLIRAYLAHFPSSPPSHPLFVYRDGAPLTYTRLVTDLRSLLARMGYDPALYSPHSFRAGSATDAAALGASSHFIQALGRWRSAAYLAYLRPSPQVQAAMARFLSQPS